MRCDYCADNFDSLCEGYVDRMQAICPACFDGRPIEPDDRQNVTQADLAHCQRCTRLDVLDVARLCLDCSMDMSD